MTETSSQTPPANIIAGMLWMVLTTIMFASVTAIVRYLGSDLPAAEAAFIRYAIGTVLLLPSLWAMRSRAFGWPAMGRFMARGFIHGIAVILWFFAMARIPMAEVTAIGYTAPIYVTIGAAVFLGERFQLRRLAAVLVGFLGALIILRPGVSEVSWGALAQVCAAPLFAVSFLMAKNFTGKYSPTVIVGFLSVFCTIALLPPALWDWRPPTLEEWFWLGMTAVIATIGHLTMTQALRNAPITVTQPVSFLQLVWAASLGIILFGEPLDPYVLVGGGIVVLAATYISRRESIAARQAATPPAPATKI